MQHLAATFALDPNTETGAAAALESERAARLAGYVDERMLENDVKRELIEQQEYDRMLAALDSALGVERLNGAHDRRCATQRRERRRTRARVNFAALK
jgi:hypothetical protein